MYFTDISYVVHPVGRVTPNGVTLLGTAFFINRRGLLATAAHVTGKWFSYSNEQGEFHSRLPRYL